MTYEPNYEQRQKINAVVDSFLEQILWKIGEGEMESIDDCMEALYECDWNECAAIGLDLDDRLDLIEQFGPDHDLELGTVTLGDLRGRLESLAVSVIHYQAEQKVTELLEALREVMDDHDLDFADLTDDNNYGYFAHRSEREPADGCTVMEYRDLEGSGQAVDVWEVRLTQDSRVYFVVDLNEEEEETA